MAEEYEEITPIFLQFENPGDVVEGTLLGHTELEIEDKIVKKWSIARVEDGRIVNFLGGVSLDVMLQALDVGTKLKLEFLGMTDLKGGHRVKEFKLFRATAKLKKSEKKD